tara:strand:+ start:84 stop:239 length:156 start_codon:yes stop_codon:yes gene_type:complete
MTEQQFYKSLPSTVTTRYNKYIQDMSAIGLKWQDIYEVVLALVSVEPKEKI